ncbi:uncharacterized protein E0L32_006255 [Thyridium curvatum]|uniref:Uncharacterized protein n=1 Tax=Thyridium curvatum TaxID=1093900 RepID=A0A507ATG7_9PEZI|nr:uncharacterized protein E0L32_006255 [Thyridium curvatum]TPX13282.1 hypothetical protein E0L32_006255 [Thyridium curvatum]
MAAQQPQQPQARPEVGDILLVIRECHSMSAGEELVGRGTQTVSRVVVWQRTTCSFAVSCASGHANCAPAPDDFQARSSDELSLAKGDRVELIERDDEFGDGWFLGKHMVNGNSGLFPEVYTRPAPKGISGVASASSSLEQALSRVHGAATTEQKPAPVAAAAEQPRSVSTPIVPAEKPKAGSVDLPLSKAASMSPPPSANSFATKSLPPIASGIGSLGRLNNPADSHVLHETLNVIDEHITDLRSPGNGGLRAPANDSGSEYSSHLDHRLSYIQGEETDEEEEGLHTRAEVEAWSADDVAEYLFTAGVEKHHCEVFRDQEISGEVLLGMDQTSVFIKAFDLGSVGRRLKTWQKIKTLQDEVNGQGPSTRRTTQTYGSDVGSDDARLRSRTNTLTSLQQKLPPIDDRPGSVQTRRSSIVTPRMDPTQAAGPVSPTALADGANRPRHEKRPSAASVRDLHHSRRHSSTEYRLTGTPPVGSSATPNKLMNSGTFPKTEPTATGGHKKQPSFDRNWTLGGARPLSSAGFQDAATASDPALQEPNLDLDRGYFSGTEVDGRSRRNVLKKRDSGVQSHSRNTSYTEEQRVRSATALSRHSRFGSVGSIQESAPSAVQKYYGIQPSAHRKTASTATTESIRPVPPAKDYPSPTVTRLDSSALDSVRSSPVTQVSPTNRQGMHGDWLGKSNLKAAGLGLRAISDAVTGNERAKLAENKDSPLQSPARTGSSTPSAGQSFELDSPNTKSPATTTTTISAKSAKRKGKKETSAYLRGLQALPPREAMEGADYSGWMKKRSSNLMTTWKARLFVLKGRRLAYYYSEDDTEEKGLIDISFHRVLPADNERLTGLHATLTGASTTPTMPAGSAMTTAADTAAEADTTKSSESMFIFKLVPPRAGLSRAVTFTKPTVHYFAVPNIKQGRLWMAALMKATIDRDDSQPITTTYQQKTISLAKARQMRHRPPALMNLDEKMEDDDGGQDSSAKDGGDAAAAAAASKKETNGLGIVYNENDSGVAGLGKLGMQGLQKVESATSRQFSFDAGDKESGGKQLPLSA